MANNCETNGYFVNLYKELQKLKSKQREAHTLDASMLDDTKNYLVSHTSLDPWVSSGVIVLEIVPKVNLLVANTHLEVALLDNATTHTIMRDSISIHLSGMTLKPGKCVKCTP